MKKSIINTIKIKWKYYFICKGSKGGETNCGKIFWNDDDNVCVYCGSKNTRRVYNIHFFKGKF